MREPKTKEERQTETLGEFQIQKGESCLLEVHDILKNLELENRGLQKYLQRDLTSVSYQKVMVFLFCLSHASVVPDNVTSLTVKE